MSTTTCSKHGILNHFRNKHIPKTVCFEMKSYSIVGNSFDLAQVTWVKVGQSKPFVCIEEIVRIFAALWTRIHFNQTWWTLLAIIYGSIVVQEFQARKPDEFQYLKNHIFFESSFAILKIIRWLRNSFYNSSTSIVLEI